MSTSIGVSAPYRFDLTGAGEFRAASPLARAWHGIMAGKAPALGDSAWNGALRLLKPQFSPTRNAPEEDILLRRRRAGDLQKRRI